MTARRSRRQTARRRQQRGAALIILMLMVILGVSWLLISAMSTWLNPAAANPNANGRVLGQAKAALLGYVAKEVMDSAEQNPGRLPCPEALGNVGTANEGMAATSCSLPAIGRLPWRTLGLDKPLDAAGEPLWYAVSPGWALPSSGATLQINFNTAGQLTLQDAFGNTVASNLVALIIAPGAPIQVQASTYCAALTQARALSSLPPPANWYQNYVECQNASYPATNNFALAGPTGSFNDQVVPISAADVMRATEGPIAQRIQTQIVPAINSVYTVANGWTNPQPLYPFAAPFSSPNPEVNPPNDGSANPATYEGVLPIAADASTEVAWLSTPPVSCQLTPLGRGASCNLCTVSSTTVSCTVARVGTPPPTLTITAYASNVGIGFRQPPGIPSNVLDPGYSSRSIQNTLQTDGTAMVVYQGVPPLGVSTVTITVNNADDAITSSNQAVALATSWFIRNQWYMFTYYAISQGFAPGGPSACGGSNPACLTLNTGTGSRSEYALLMFAGRALAGVNAPVRPSGQLTSYFEGANNTSGGLTFDSRSAVTSSINDRVLAISP